VGALWVVLSEVLWVMWAASGVVMGGMSGAACVAALEVVFGVVL